MELLDGGSLGLIESEQGFYTAALIDGFICTEFGVNPLKTDLLADTMGPGLYLGAGKHEITLTKPEAFAKVRFCDACRNHSQLTPLFQGILRIHRTLSAVHSCRQDICAASLPPNLSAERIPGVAVLVWWVRAHLHNYLCNPGYFPLQPCRPCLVYRDKVVLFEHRHDMGCWRLLECHNRHCCATSAYATLVALACYKGKEA